MCFLLTTSYLPSPHRIRESEANPDKKSPNLPPFLPSLVRIHGTTTLNHCSSTQRLSFFLFLVRRVKRQVSTLLTQLETPVTKDIDRKDKKWSFLLVKIYNICLIFSMHCLGVPGIRYPIRNIKEELNFLGTKKKKKTRVEVVSFLCRYNQWPSHVTVGMNRTGCRDQRSCCILEGEKITWKVSFLIHVTSEPRVKDIKRKWVIKTLTSFIYEK